MASPRWGFSTSAKRYRDLDSGRFLAKKTVIALRDQVVAKGGQEARDLAARAVSGAVTPEVFREEMRIILRNVFTSEMAFGRGGIPSMTSGDFGRLRSTLARAFDRLETLVTDLTAQRVSEAQAANRAQMAVDGGIRAYELGKSSSWGIAGQLPLMPGDNCEGLSRCRCSWSISETDTTIDAYWTLGGSDPCSPCQQNASRWAPWSTPKPYAVPDNQPVRLAAIRRVA